MEKRTTSVQANQASMYCNNCGGKGHLFRTCADPVLSCGILLINKPGLPVTPGDVNLLMIRRKDSMSFAEFMRGKYDTGDTEYVARLIKNMTLKEQANVASEPFETLWKNLWGDDRMSTDFAIARDKFNRLDRYSLVRDNLSEYTEPEWGFPKGRRTRGESDLDCALREFAEETNVPRSAFVVLKNIVLEETFTGLNNIRYRHVYFIALLKQPGLIDLKQKFTPMQRREISGIAWKTMDEVDVLIRPHYVERKSMMDQLKIVLQSYETSDD